MNISQFASVTSRPYSSLLREIEIRGKRLSSKQLNFHMEYQTQSNWCWAATATSVSHFYSFLSTWTQCLVANGELGLSNCCNSSVPTACNVPWYLDRALTRTHNFKSVINGKVPFQQIKEEIDENRPVGARVGWSGGGGHFMVIYGYSSVAGTDYFDIADPSGCNYHLPVAEFASKWTHTYLTQSSSKMSIKLLIPSEATRRLIWEVRPLLQLKQDMSFNSELHAATDVGDASLGMAQRVYSLGLDALLKEQSPMPQPVNLRVYEISGATARAFFDVSETDHPSVLQMSASEKHLASFERALSEVLIIVGQSDQECELRLFRVPALNFETLWIHYEGDGRDVLVPLYAVRPLPQYKAVPLQEALKVLREAATPLTQMDDTMGA